MHQDRYGLPLSTGSSDAAEAYRDGIDRMLSAWTGAAEAFERAIAADPDFALAHIARARIHTFYQQGDVARKKAWAAQPGSFFEQAVNPPGDQVDGTRESTADCRIDSACRAAPALQTCGNDCRSPAAIDADLQAVISAWPSIPTAIRRAILSLLCLQESNSAPGVAARVSP